MVRLIICLLLLALAPLHAGAPPRGLARCYRAKAIRSTPSCGRDDGAAHSGHGGRGDPSR